MQEWKELVEVNLLSQIEETVRNGNISHGYLICGEEYSGKKTLAKIFAKAILCKEAEMYCGKCTSCLQVDNENHPDFFYLRYEKETSISVDEIRKQINQTVAVKPYASERKVYIVPDADKMTQEAQNALLKTLEEPPEYVTILLLASNPHRFLPTILSRVVQWKIKPVAQEKIVSLLVSKYEVEESKAEFCAGFSMGNIGKAIRLATVSDYQEIYDFCIHLLKYIHEMPVHEIIYAMKDLSKHKLKINEYLDFIMVWYRDVLMLKATNNPNKILFKKEYKDISKQSQRSSFEGLEHIITAIDKAKQRLDANVNFDLAMELLMLTIKEN